MRGELCVKAEDEKLMEVLAFVDGYLEQFDCSPKTQMLIDVAVEELFVNIAHYAYPKETGNVTIQMEITEKSRIAQISFMDSGIPYNPLEKLDPDVTLSSEERSIGGLGIYMVKKKMDDMSYQFVDGKNVLSIKKAIS